MSVILGVGGQIGNSASVCLRLEVLEMHPMASYVVVVPLPVWMASALVHHPNVDRELLPVMVSAATTESLLPQAHW